MLKKALCILLSCSIFFTLSACKGDDEMMYIEPAQLSTEEENLGKLLGLDSDHVIYDFVLEDGVQTMEVNTYVLNDGKWDMISGGGQKFEDTTGRLALGYDKIAEGVRIAVQSDNESGATSYAPTPTTNVDYSQLAIATAKLDKRTEMVFDEEIPLVVQIMTSKNEIRTFSTEQFFEPNSLEEQGHEYVYAITVRFSQKTVSELDAERSE